MQNSPYSLYPKRLLTHNRPTSDQQVTTNKNDKNVKNDKNNNKARVGQKVKRGEVIGYIGNTGKSTGPHLHYEVHKKGQPVDPIYYFYNDLTPAQFERITKLAKASNQSLD